MHFLQKVNYLNLYMCAHKHRITHNTYVHTQPYTDIVFINIPRFVPTKNWTNVLTNLREAFFF